MNRAQALRILGPCYEEAGGALSLCESDYIEWEPGERTARVFGCFSADQLEAIAVIMRNITATQD